VSLAQRIGGLNNVGSAARPRAGGIEDEALSDERVRDQRAALRAPRDSWRSPFASRRVTAPAEGRSEDAAYLLEAAASALGIQLRSLSVGIHHTSSGWYRSIIACQSKSHWV